MIRSCPDCGPLELPRESRFCPLCGGTLANDLPAAPIRAPYTPEHLSRDVLTTRTARDGERKEVTILFVDIAGSLAMAEALDPEDIHTIMQGFFAIALDAVHAQNGTVNQFRGDGLMALFGAPRARDEDAARALRAALAIRSRTRAYSESVESRFGIPIILRLGLHTGTVWVGSVGDDLRRDYTAEGPTVGLAARLEQAAGANQILVSEETARRAHALFDFKELGVRELRGLSKPVRVFELVKAGLFGDRFDVERASGFRPLVGRASELQKLRSEARPGGRPSWIEIVGEAGIGKSRVLHDYVREREAHMTVRVARSREADALRAYATWLELLRDWPEHVPGALAAAELVSRLGGDPSRVAGTREEFIARLAELLGAALRPGPVLVAIDDAHWIDPSSREVLRALCERPDLAGLVVVTTARPEGQSEDCADTRIDLPRLAPEAGRAVARSILVSIEDSEPLVELSVERGGGNPLFIQEVARALRDGDDEVRRSARLEVELRHAGQRVPETLTGVIAARVDALPDPAKRLLQAASVIGRSFDSGLLTSLEPDREGDVSVLLALLVERSLLEPVGNQSLEFSHILVQEVGYAQLLSQRRATLHRRCAQLLAERGEGGTPAGASSIGGHYDRAGVAAEAAEYLAEAGRAYLALSAPHEACAHLQRAWDLVRASPLADADSQVPLALALVSALNALDRSGDAARILESLPPANLGAGDQRRLATLFIEGGWVRFSDGADVARGRELIERGLAIAEQLGNGERLAMGAYAHLIRLHTQDGDIGQALHCAARLRALADEVADPFFTVFACCAAGSALCDRGDRKGALAACREGAAVAERSGNPVATAMAQAWLAQALVCCGEADDALAAARRALDAGQRSDQAGAIYHAWTWAGEAHLLRGDPRQAFESFERLAEINERWPSTLFRRARGLLAMGRYAEAALVARECLSREPGRVVRARVLCTLGHALGLGVPAERSESDRALRESIQLCTELELRPYHAEALRALAAVCGQRGDSDQAARHEEQAARLLDLDCG